MTDPAQQRAKLRELRDILRELRRHIIRLAPVGSILRVLIDEAIQIVIEDAE